MPGCYDPRGYSNVLLMHVNGATANGSSASSTRASLHFVWQIQHRLISALKLTTDQLGQEGEPTC
jgi:hypothetical protein